MIRKWIQKIKCSLPFSPFHFWHKNIVVVKELSRQVDLIQCTDCGKKFAMNHRLEMILPYEDIKPLYYEMKELFEYE